MPKIDGMPATPGPDFRFEVRKTTGGSVILHLTERQDSGDWYSVRYEEICKSIYDLTEIEVIATADALLRSYYARKMLEEKRAKAEKLLGVVE